MPETDFVTCPSCRARVWEDLAALGDNVDPFRFRCVRCGHIIKLSGCSKCKATHWDRLKNTFEKNSKKPVVRYQCSACSRVIGLVLD